MKCFSATSLAALVLFAGVAADPPTVAAQGFWDPGYGSNYRPRSQALQGRNVRRPAAAARPKVSAEEKAALATPASGPIMAVVSLAGQKMTVYDSTGPILRTPISSGTASHRTPTGVFSVLQKNRHHRSNIYSGAPMPYMQRLTWSGIALHAGVLPGYPASHGCIRLPYPVAAKLFAMSKMGMRVIVAPNETQAASFSHPALPEPLMVAAAETRTRAEGDGPLVRVATVEGQGAASAMAAVATKFLNPMQAAQIERTQSKQRIVDAIRINKQLLEESQRASADANASAEFVKEAKAYHESLRQRLERTPEDARGDLAEQVIEADRAARFAAAIAADKNRTAFEAAVASRDAEAAVTAAEDAAKIAERGTEPIAVFISRKESKVFVRQGMVPLFDAPVTFKEPSRPVGTHVFQVMAGDTATGGLTWKTVTVPEGGSFGESIENRGPVRRGARAEPAAPVGPPSDARGALERVEMDADVKKKISQRLWINGSITISDHGISNETGKGTDFVVLTR